MKWYKMVAIPVLCCCLVPALAQTAETPADTRLAFPHFVVTIPGFGVIGPEYGSSREEGDTLAEQLIYNGGDRIWGLRVKKDTIRLYESIDESIQQKQIRISSVRKTDSFAVFYAYGQRLDEVFDHRGKTREEEQRWAAAQADHTYRSAYRPLKRSGARVFKVPAYDGYKIPAALKRQYRLHDTLVTIPREYDITASLTDHRQRLFTFGATHILLRIDRYVKGKRVEKKVIIVWFNDSC